jgi:hypothetical protein
MQRLNDYENYKISLPLINWASCLVMDARHDEAEEMLLGGLAGRVARFGENDQESFMYVLLRRKVTKLTVLVPVESIMDSQTSSSVKTWSRKALSI